MGTINELNKRMKSKSLPNYFQVASLTSDPTTIAHKFNLFFTEIGPTLANTIPMTDESPLQLMNLSQSSKFQFIPVSCNEVCDILLSLKNTASGHNRLDAKLAKDVVDFIITPLPHILNL